VGKKLRDKDYRTGYEKGFKDALKIALDLVDKEIDYHNEKVKNEKEYSSC
jgi:hypothetical protein